MTEDRDRQPGSGEPTANFRPDWDRQSIVDGLRHSRDVTHNIRHLGRLRPPPSRDDIIEAIHGIATALFPAHYGQQTLTLERLDAFVGETLDEALALLGEQVRRSLPFSVDELRDEGEFLLKAKHIIRDFAAALPHVRGLLVSDLKAAYAGDPAATGISEILLVYPGFSAIMHYRLAHVLHTLGANLLARFIATIAHSRTGIDIHPGASIGASFFIDHGTGVVLGETTVVGDRVRIYQAVTLGARSFRTDDDGALVKGEPRHPIIEDDVTIYAGATILGRVTVGKGSTIGGNVWLTHDVPPGTSVRQARAQEDIRRP